MSGMLSFTLNKVPNSPSPAYKLNGVEGLPETYLFHSTPSEAIVLDQGMAGEELEDHSAQASRAFLNVAYNVCLKGEPRKNFCNVVLLSGGLYYNVKRAFEERFGSFLPQVIIGVRRARNEDNSFRADFYYSNFEAVPENGVYLFGDTIATGVSLERSILELRDEVKRKGFKMRKAVVFTLVGALKGARVLRRVEREVRRDFPDFRLYLFASEALFGLEPNDTDMPFYHENTIMTPEIAELLKSHPAVAKRMECAVFDWGERFSPHSYLPGFVDYCNKLIRREWDDGVREELVFLRDKAVKDFERVRGSL